MFFVDSHLHTADVGWESFKSMYLAGIRVVVSPAQLAAAKAVGNETIKDVWDYQLEVQINRVKENMIKSYAMIGISMVSTPRDDLAVLLKLLPDYLQLPEVVAVGEIGIEPGSNTSKDLNFQEKIVREQIKILKDFKKTVVFHIPFSPENKIKYTQLMLDICKEYDFPMSKVVIDHCSDANIEIALQAGAYAGITVQPWRGITPEIAAALIVKYGYDRIMVNSDCSPLRSDPLSVVKTAYVLQKKGVAENLIQKVCSDNALEAYALQSIN
jgi:predicted metal-dependent TIM-barrel fold hydrolase